MFPLKLWCRILPYLILTSSGGCQSLACLGLQLCPAVTAFVITGHSPCVSVLVCSFPCKDGSHTELKPYLQIPCFQIRWHSQVLGVRVSVYIYIYIYIFFFFLFFFFFLATPWTGAFQAPLSMGFPRQWVAISFSRDHPDPGTEPTSLVCLYLQVDSFLLPHVFYFLIYFYLFIFY